MRITRGRLRQIIREELTRSLNEATESQDTSQSQSTEKKAFNIEALAKATMERFNEKRGSAPAIKKIGRTKVSAMQQNIDLIYHGPYKADVKGQIQGKKPGWSFFSLYSKSPDSPFHIYQKYAQKYVDAAKTEKSVSGADIDRIMKAVWNDMTDHEEGTGGYKDYMKTEKYWEKAGEAATEKGVGTHDQGTAFDLPDYKKGSSRNHLDLLYTVAAEVAEEFGAEFLRPGKGSIEEVDHIHMSYKV